MSTELEALPAIGYLQQESLAALRNALARAGYRIFELDGRDITDAASFFAKIIHVFPHDPPLSGQVHWDAFSDSVFYGLSELGEPKAAVL